MSRQQIVPHPLSAFVQVMKAESGAHSMAETPEGARARHRAARFVECLVQRQLTPRPSDLEEFALCAMEFEALRTEEELSSFLQAFESRFSFEQRVFVSWSRAGTIERREISDFTLLAAKGLDFAGVRWPLVVQDVRTHLAQWYPFSRAIAVSDRIHEVLKDAQALWCAVLPKPVAFHHLGISELTLLSDACWTRRTSGAPAPRVQRTGETELTREIEEKIVEVLSDSSSTLTGSWFVTQLIGVCNGLTGPGIRRTDAVVKRELERKLHGLAREVDQAGPRAALLLGWALDIAQFGSARKEDPALKTIANYLRAACMPLFTALSARAVHPLSLDDEGWSDLIDKLLADTSDPLLKPALASFHRYLVREHGIAPRPALFRMECDVRTPRSNVVWEHEFAALAMELDRQTADPRCREQLQVWRAMLKRTSLRIGELAGLSLRDIDVTPTAVRIHVTSAGRTSLKSEAAARTPEIRDSEECEVISRWIDKRRKEAATRQELMFADPYDLARVYRFAHCYVAFSRALKIVTGDEQASPHITRHTFLSFRAESCVVQIIKGVEELNALEALRCDAGHARIETTFTVYSHLVERTVRRSMDAFLCSKLMRACDVARWTGATHEAIRQRRHRNKDWNPWQALHAALPVERQQAFLKEAPLDATPPPAVAPTLEHVMKVAGDWVEGRTVAATSSRCGLSEEDVKQAIEAIALACRHICAIRGTKGLKERDWRAWTADECDFRRLNQDRWERAARTIVGQDFLPQVQRWLSCCARGGIDLADQWAGSLLRFLNASGFGPESFVVKATTQGLAQAARAPFMATFGVLPATELVAPRRGRSASYGLLLTTTESGDRLVPGKTSEMKAVLALLIAASAYACTLEREES